MHLRARIVTPRVCDYRHLVLSWLLTSDNSILAAYVPLFYQGVFPPTELISSTR